MAQTTSTGAKKIQDSDNWRDIFADHNDTVDAYDGVITGTVSVITGTTNNTGHTIAAGEYFIANGSKYKATASIPSNTAWASSATAVSDIDIINSLNSAIKTVSTNLGSASSASSVTGADAFSKIDALNSNITSLSDQIAKQDVSSYFTKSASVSLFSAIKSANVIDISFECNTGAYQSGDAIISSIPQGYRPKLKFLGVIINASTNDFCGIVWSNNSYDMTMYFPNSFTGTPIGHFTYIINS